MRELTIFCDGGCRGNGSADALGAWAYTLKDSLTGKIYSDSAVARPTTNNQMELNACIHALLKVVDLVGEKPIDTIVMIYPDSQYVIDGMTKWLIPWVSRGWRTADGKPVKNQDLWIKLTKLVGTQTSVRFNHVLGHSGVFGNEEVDRMVNIAMNLASGANH